MVPSDHMQEAVSYVTRAVLEGRYPEAIYEHPAGAAQLAGLAPKQVALWKETSETTAVEGLVAKDEGGLEVFWATKVIGRPIKHNVCNGHGIARIKGEEEGDLFLMTSSDT